MFNTSETDYLALETYRFGWRWTDIRRIVIPEDDLIRIKPLSIEKAKEAWEYANRLQGSSYRTRFKEVDTFEVDGRGTENSDAEVAHWLQKYLSSGSDTIYVSWTEQQAMTTDVRTFVLYWETFCFPVEDVVIWPQHEQWVLLFDYKQRFYFAIARDR